MISMTKPMYVLNLEPNSILPRTQLLSALIARLGAR
jgi:hypothetical protein